MSDSESTGGKYDSDDSFFDPTAEYGWLGEYGKLLRACGLMIGEFVLSNRPTYPPDPVYVIPSGLPQPEVPSWVELVARSH